MAGGGGGGGALGNLGERDVKANSEIQLSFLISLFAGFRTGFDLTESPITVVIVFVPIKGLVHCKGGWVFRVYVNEHLIPTLFRSFY